MRWSALLWMMVLLIPHTTMAQEQDYWELYEGHAASSAAKYHDVLISIEAGDIDAARDKLLTYQSAEIMVLERLREQLEISSRSEALIEMVREYNQRNSE